MSVLVREMLGTAPKRPMGKSVRVPDSLGHKHSGDLVITGPRFELSGLGLSAGCEGCASLV